MRIPILPVALILFIAAPIYAVTYIVPPDREMIQLSDDIVVATGVTSLVERNAHGGIVTRYTLRVEDVLKGDRAPGDHLILTERGGVIDGEIRYIFGTPTYEAGERYLVFTETNADAEPVTFGMALGQFFLTTDKGRKLALRGEVEGFDQNFEPYREQARDADAFLRYVRGIVASSIDPEPHYFVKDAPTRFEPASELAIAAEATRTSYLMSSGGRPFRWQDPTATFVKSGTAVGPDGNAAVALAFSQWNGTNSDIRYSDGGQDDTATGGLTTADGKDAILFNDPNNEVGSGIAGLGGISEGGSPYTLGGESFWNIFEVDVVMNNGSYAQNCYNSVMVHEVGHTLAFRHSNQPPATGDPSTTNAIMNATVQCSWNGILKQYDHDAATTVYGPETTVPPAAPTNIVATATSTTTVRVTWTAAADTTSYNVYRSTNGSTYTLAGSTSGTAFDDTGRTANTSYLYRVRSVGSSESGDSNRDLATTTIFTDDPLVPVTPIKAVHITELRIAINAVRILAGIGAVTYGDPTITPGSTVKADHITTMRMALNQALTALGLPTVSPPEAITAGTLIRARHITDTRNGVK